MGMTDVTIQVKRARLRLQRTLAGLAAVLVEHGAPAYDPFGPYEVPSRTAMTSLDAADAADWGIALVHAIFQKRRLPGAVTTATKEVGNAARALRHAVEREHRKHAEAA
jgi:hypothetical protein